MHRSSQVFQMEVSFNFNDSDKLLSRNRITFVSLDFIVNRLRTCTYRNPEPVVQEEEPPYICLFLTRIEDTVAAGAPALARHMDPYARDFSNDFDRGHLLD